MPTSPLPARSRRSGSPLLFPALALPIVLSLLGWTASYLFNAFNSDVTMPDWSVDLALIAAEILPALRSAVLLAFVACLAYMKAGIGPVLLTACAGIFSNILFGLGSTWLSEGFGLFNPPTLLTDAVLCAAAFFIGYGVRRRAERAQSVRERKNWGMRKAAVLAALPASVLPALYALLDLIEHVSRRGAYTAEEWASGTAHFTGIFIRRILIYGVLGAFAAYLAASLSVRLLARRRTGTAPGTPPKF